MVNTTFGPRRFAFKKNSGKLSDYWEFVKHEGFRIFRSTHGHSFDRTDRMDQELMGAIWKAQPQEKRDQYKTYTISMNCSELVHARRQNDSAKYRETNQIMGRHVLNVKRRHKMKQEMEHRERIRYYRPIVENDLSNYMINNETPIFFNEKMFEIKRKKELDKAISSIRFKCTEQNPAYVIRQHTLLLIKVNIFDSVYLPEFYLSRTHPSEISLCVFNLSDGVKRTHSFLVKFEGRMLYNQNDGIPPQRYEKVKKMENDTGLFHNSEFAQHSVFEIFSLLYNTWKTEYPTALPVVQSGDWNKTVGSLFLLAHAAEMPHEFHEIFLKLSILDDQLLAVGETWKRFRGDGAYKELNPESVRANLKIPLRPIHDNSRFYCEYHQRMKESQKINCALARAASCIQNFFSICADVNISDWQSSYISRKSDENFFFCKELGPGLSVVENHIDSVTANLVSDSDSEDIVISDEDLERVTRTIENVRLSLDNPSPPPTRIDTDFDERRRSSAFPTSPRDIAPSRLLNATTSTSEDMPSTSLFRLNGSPFTPSEHSRSGVSFSGTSNSFFLDPSISMRTITPNNRHFSDLSIYRQHIYEPSERKSSFPEPGNVFYVSVPGRDCHGHQQIRPSKVTLEFTIMYDNEVQLAEMAKLKNAFKGKNITPPSSPSQRLLWSYTQEAKYFRLTNSG